jgi:hypothetical protein
MNDLRLLNDPDTAGRWSLSKTSRHPLNVPGRKGGDVSGRRNRILNKRAEAFLALMGKTLCYDLAGQGKLKLRRPVTH